jgi:Transcription factor WhiB
VPQARDLFDREDPEAIAEAITICGRCPERQRCAAWASTVSPHKLFCVIAGHRYTPNHKIGSTP